MRAALLSLALLFFPAATEAQEVPYEFRGTWGLSKQECVARKADSYRTFMGNNYLIHNKTRCNMSNIKTDGEGFKSNISCDFEGYKQEGTLNVSPTPQGAIVIDLRAEVFTKGRATLALKYFCGHENTVNKSL
jgi:hypothetical protein